VLIHFMNVSVSHLNVYLKKAVGFRVSQSQSWASSSSVTVGNSGALS
jgi:hypothetical protein